MKKTPPKAAIVTGGAVRIGRAICQRLAELNYQVAIHYHQSRKEALSLRKFIQLQGGKAEIFKCNLGQAQQTEKLILQVQKTFPNLVLLINNASVFEPSQIKTFTVQEFHRDINVNLLAPMLLTRDFANICKKGHIINILDTHITDNQTQHLAYLLAKKTLNEFTKMAAVDLSPSIRVNAIAPGLILAPVNKPNNHLERLAKNIPLKKTGNCQNILQSLEFLLKNEYLNGQVLFNDGGEHLI